MPEPPVLLLVGAGHAHLHLLAEAESLRAAGHDVHLLAPATFAYSGVASATAAGVLPPGSGTIDVAWLAGRTGVRHHVARLVSVDLPGHRVLTSDGVWLAWDVLSVNIGSVVSTDGLVVDPDVLRVKPLEQLATLAERVREAAPRGARVTVVGGGPSGLELAGHLSVLPGVTSVLLLEAGPVAGGALPEGARRRVRRLLADRAVVVRTGVGVTEVRSGHVLTRDGEVLDHDVVVLATGLMAPPLLAATGLGGPQGVPVRATLQHRDHDEVYAAGDCADFLPGRLPRIGVHGVRQGPVLLASLLSRRRGEALPAYRPQRHALQVLDLGGGVGLAARGRWWWQGASALRLKRVIDRRWLAAYRP